MTKPKALTTLPESFTPGPYLHSNVPTLFSHQALKLKSRPSSRVVTWGLELRGRLGVQFIFWEVLYPLLTWNLPYVCIYIYIDYRVHKKDPSFR